MDKLDLANKRRAVHPWKNMQLVQEFILQKIIEVCHVTQEHPKERRTSIEPIRFDPKDRLAHEIKCLMKENEEQRVIIGSLKKEAKKGAWVHEAAVSDNHKDRIIAKYRSKTERCSYALEVMQKKGLRQMWYLNSSETYWPASLADLSLIINRTSFKAIHFVKSCLKEKILVIKVKPMIWNKLRDPTVLSFNRLI